MEEKEAVKRLKELAVKAGTDIKAAHSEADDILLKFVPNAVRFAYNKVDKYYA